MNDDEKAAAIERAILEAIPTTGLPTVELDIDIVQKRSFVPYEYAAAIRRLMAEGRIERVGDRYLKRALVVLVFLFMGAPAHAGDLVTVDVFGDGGGMLQHAEANTSEWKDVCITPCRKEVSRSGRYRVQSSAYASKPIVLRGTSDDIALYAKVGHPDSTGLVVAVLGFVVAGAGFITLDAAVFAALSCSLNVLVGCADNWMGVAGAIGGVVLGVGLIVGFVGLVSRHNIRATVLHQVDVSFAESKQERPAMPQIPVENLPFLRVTF